MSIQCFFDRVFVGSVVELDVLGVGWFFRNSLWLWPFWC